MTTLQAMLLGAMIALTPSLLVLAYVLRDIPHAPGEDRSKRTSRRRSSPHFSHNRMLLRSAMGFFCAAKGGRAGLWRRMRGLRSDIFGSPWASG